MPSSKQSLKKSEMLKAAGAVLTEKVSYEVVETILRH